MDEKEPFFPTDTLNWMLKQADFYLNYNSPLLKKLATLQTFTDAGKMNRWFGYCQRMGEEKGIWRLEEIIEKVRAERLRNE